MLEEMAVKNKERVTGKLPKRVYVTVISPTAASLFSAITDQHPDGCHAAGLFSTACVIREILVFIFSISNHVL